MVDNQMIPEKWLEINVCLMNKRDQEDKTNGKIGATDVHMICMSIKVDTGCRELALPEKLVKELNLDYVDTVNVSSSTDSNVPIKRYGVVLIHWGGLTYEALAYCMPSLDSALLGLIPLLTMKPDFDWQKKTLKHSIFSFPCKRYYIDMKDIEKIMDQEKIKFFEDNFKIKIHLTNEYGHKMILTICAIRFDVNLDVTGEAVSHFAPSIKPIDC